MVAVGPPVRPYRVISVGPALPGEFPRSRGSAGAGGAAGGLAGWRGAAAGGTASRCPPAGCDAPSCHILNPRLLCPAGTVRAPTCSPREALRFDASVPRAAPVPAVPCRAMPPGLTRVPCVPPPAGAAHRQPVGADVLPAVPPRAQGLGGAVPQRAGFPRREAAAGLRANAGAEPAGRNAAVDLPELPEERGGGRAAGGAGAGPGGRREQGLGAAEGGLDPKTLLPLHSVFSPPGLVVPHVLQVAVLWGWLPLLFLFHLLLLLLVPRELRGLGPQLFPVCSQALGALELAAHQRGGAGQSPRGPPCCAR